LSITSKSSDATAGSSTSEKSSAKGAVSAGSSKTGVSLIG